MKKESYVIEKGHIMTADEVRVSAERASRRGWEKVVNRAKISIESGQGNPDWMLMLRKRIRENK